MNQIILYQNDLGDATLSGLDSIYEKIAVSKRIVVMTGAGISCSSGIPVCFYQYLFLGN
jgi:hypothetical protein